MTQVLKIKNVHNVSLSSISHQWNCIMFINSHIGSQGLQKGSLRRAVLHFCSVLLSVETYKGLMCKTQSCERIVFFSGQEQELRQVVFRLT